MLKDVKRWIALRDGKEKPNCRDELIELVAFEIGNFAAWEEQQMAQRRPPGPIKISAERRRIAEQVIDTVVEAIARGVR